MQGHIENEIKFPCGKFQTESSLVNETDNFNQVIISRIFFSLFSQIQYSLVNKINIKYTCYIQTKTKQ